MAAHVLDNPIWSSLRTRHRGVALGAGDLLRYPPEVAPFLGAPEGALSLPDLEALVTVEETVFLIGPRPVAPPGWTVEDLGPLLQMVCEKRMAGEADVELLSQADRGEVLALTALVYPHYFRPRTQDLGRYFGLRVEGRLAAMVGERMGMPGFREVSALCTHPDFVGRGYGRRLLAFLTNETLGRGETPFLHVSPQNRRAADMYERAGYRTRSEVPFWSLRRAG